LPLALQPRCDPEAHQPHSAGGRVHESVGGLDVLVDETVLVNPAERGRQSNGDTKELSQVDRRSNETAQRFSSGVLEHQRRTALVRCERERPNSPVGIQLGS
jgi:hypothetical protein